MNTIYKGVTGFGYNVVDVVASVCTPDNLGPLSDRLMKIFKYYPSLTPSNPTLLTAISDASFFADGVGVIVFVRNLMKDGLGDSVAKKISMLGYFGAVCTDAVGFSKAIDLAEKVVVYAPIQFVSVINVVMTSRVVTFVASFSLRQVGTAFYSVAILSLSVDIGLKAYKNESAEDRSFAKLVKVVKNATELTAIGATAAGVSVAIIGPLTIGVLGMFVADAWVSQK